MIKRFALAVVALWVLAVPAGAQGAFQVRIREAALDPGGAVRLVVSVTGEATGQVLTAGNFAVTEAGRPIPKLAVQPLLESKTQPVAVALLMDVSGSMAGKPIADARTAAKTFVEQLPDGVRVALVAFGPDAQLRRDFTTDRGSMISAVDGLAAGGETALYDALDLAATLLDRVQAQHNIVVFTDGRDTVSKKSLQDVVAAARAAKAPVTSVGLVTKDLDQSVLDTLATETGARSVPVAQSAQLAGAFSAVARDIASQYVLTYTSTAATPKELELSVAVTVSGLKIGDAIAVLNPRSVALAPGEAAEGEHVGVFGSSLGLYVGLGAAFLAIALLLGMVFSRTRGGAAVRVLRRGLRLYSRGQKKEPEASAMTTALGRRVVELVEQAPKPKGYEEKVQIRLDRAGWPLRASEFLVLRGLGAVIGILLGLGLLGLWWLGIVLMVIGVMIPEIILRQRTEKRNAAFMEQLPDTLQLLSGSLQAGYGLVQAIDTVARESRPPTSVEFGRALTETRLGMPLEEALEGMAERIGGEDFRWVVLAINIQRQVGGNLAALLETVAATLREREQLRRQVKVLSAEGRLSAIILTALPILLVAYMSVVNPSYIGTLTHYTIGKVMIVGGIGLLIVGMVWMRKMIRIEV